MGLHALLTLDLERGVSSEQRNKVYEHLKANKWAKLPNLTTTWRAKFSDDVSADSAVAITKSDVKAAAEAGRVSQYEAAVHLGPAYPVEF